MARTDHTIRTQVSAGPRDGKPNLLEDAAFPARQHRPTRTEIFAALCDTPGDGGSEWRERVLNGASKKDLAAVRRALANGTESEAELALRELK